MRWGTRGRACTRERRPAAAPGGKEKPEGDVCRTERALNWAQRRTVPDSAGSAKAFLPVRCLWLPQVTKPWDFCPQRLIGLSKVVNVTSVYEVPSRQEWKTQEPVGAEHIAN